MAKVKKALGIGRHRRMFKAEAVFSKVGEKRAAAVTENKPVAAITPNIALAKTVPGSQNNPVARLSPEVQVQISQAAVFAEQSARMVADSKQMLASASAEIATALKPKGVSITARNAEGFAKQFRVGDIRYKVLRTKQGLIKGAEPIASK